MITASAIETKIQYARYILMARNPLKDKLYHKQLVKINRCKALRIKEERQFLQSQLMGDLTLKLLVQLHQQYMAKPLSEEEVDKFQNFCMKFEQSMDKAFLREAFKIMDRDGNGTVNAAELKALMTAVEKKPVSDKQVNDAIKKVDKNGDGLIDLNEFIESILDQMA